jgi:hypothetical protein
VLGAQDVANCKIIVARVHPLSGQLESLNVSVEFVFAAVETLYFHTLAFMK